MWENRFEKNESLRGCFGKIGVKYTCNIHDYYSESGCLWAY